MGVITSSCRQLEALTFQKSFSKDLMKIQLNNGILWESSLTPVDLPGSLCILSSAPLTALACFWCLYPRGGAGRHCPRHATTLLLSPHRHRAVTAARRAAMAPLWSCAEQRSRDSSPLLGVASRCVSRRHATGTTNYTPGIGARFISPGRMAPCRVGLSSPRPARSDGNTHETTAARLQIKLIKNSE